MQYRNNVLAARCRAASIGAVLFVGLLCGAARSSQAQEGAVFTSTNALSGNAIVSFRRSKTGALSDTHMYSTGGTGTGSGLGTAGAVILSPHNQLLFTVNAGSNDISVFAVLPNGLALLNRVSSGGKRPSSLTINGDVLYVVNSGTPANITGFELGDNGRLTPIPGSTQPFSTATVTPGQIKFSPFGNVIVVTEQTTNLIDVYPVAASGAAGPPVIVHSQGVHPYGFDFDWAGHLLVSEAASSSASSYYVSTFGTLPIAAVVQNGQAAACWLISSRDGRYAWTANAASDNISAYAIAPDGSLNLITSNDGIAATVPTGSHPLDMAVDAYGHFYVLDELLGDISSFGINRNGTLDPVGMAPSVGSLIASGLAAY